MLLDMTKLKPRECRVIDSLLQTMDFSDTAAELGLSVGTVRVYLHDARQALCGRKAPGPWEFLDQVDQVTA